MTKKTINIGQTANDRKGDSLRAAFGKVNDNFSELYTALGLNSGGLNIAAFEFTGSTISTTDSSAIVIDQATTVTSNLTVGGDLLPSIANGGDLGSSAKPWRSLYVSNNTIYLGGTALAVNQSGQLTVGGVAANTSDRLINATDKIVLNEEGATRLSMYLNNVEKTRIQINGNDLLLSSLAGGVVLAATDGVGGEWRFKTNGNLESTGGNFLSAAETPAVFGSLNSTSTSASSGTVTLKSGTGNVDGGSIYIEAGTGGSGNDGEVAIRTGSGPYEWSFDNGGNLTIPGEIHGKQLIGVGGVANGRVVNITPADNASNKKFGFRVDQFGETFTRAYLDMPEAQNNKQVAISFPHANSTVGYIFTQGANTSDDGLNNAFNIFYNAGDIKLTAMTPSTGAFKTWKFGSDGDLTLPGNLQSNGNINIEINLADSTMRRWSFGEDGDFTIPGELNVPQKINIGSGGFLEYSSGNFFVDGSNIIIGNSGGMSYWGFNSSTGNITFPDATVQSTAALTYTNFGDSGVRTDGGTGNNFWKPIIS